MNDKTNAYINAYVDNSVGMLHEYVTMILQLRTQNKIANDMVGEKDSIISSLQEEIERIKADANAYKSQVGNNSELVNQSRAEAIKWQQEYNDMKTKMGHVNSLTSQMNQMKKEIIAKNKEIESLKEKLSPKPSAPKKVINTPKDTPKEEPKEEKREAPIVMKVPEPEEKNDDF